jgi:hypothetical protein
MRLSELKKLVAQLTAGGSGGGGEQDFDATFTPQFYAEGTGSGLGMNPQPQLITPHFPTVPNMIYALVDVAEGDSAFLDVSLPSWDGSDMTIQRTPVVGTSMLSGRIPAGTQYKVSVSSGGSSSVLDISEVPIR